MRVSSQAKLVVNGWQSFVTVRLNCYSADLFLVGDATEVDPVPYMELLWPMDAPDKLIVTVANTPHGTNNLIK